MTWGCAKTKLLCCIFLLGVHDFPLALDFPQQKTIVLMGTSYRNINFAQNCLALVWTVVKEGLMDRVVRFDYAMDSFLQLNSFE